MRNTYRFRTPKGVRSEETKAIRDAAASRQASKRAAGLLDALVQRQQ
jgi:hypothetical protein